MLVPKHNGYKKVSAELQWSDFYQFTPWYPFPQEEDENDHPNENAHWKQIVVPHNDTTSLSFTDYYSVHVQQHLVTTKSNFTNVGIVQTLEEIVPLSFTTTNQSFHWDIQAVYLDKDKGFHTAVQQYFQQLAERYTITHLVPLVHQDNSFIHMQTGTNVAQAAQVLTTRLRQQVQYDDDNNNDSSVIMGTWHIRRGDSIHDCDTSLLRMKQFVQCSFGPLEELNNVRVVVLVRTDEKDETYRQGLFALFDEFQHVQAIDYDTWILDQLYHHKHNDDDDDDNTTTTLVWPKSYQNNYHHFLLEDETLPLLPLQFTLQHRRDISCQDCENVLAQLSGIQFL
jgi:hypothetical protein